MQVKEKIKEDKMKVVITKNNDENYWYNDRIGEVFEVEETRHSLYYRANGRYKGCYIDKSDCWIIEENRLEGADKLSKQIITNEWAKMPKANGQGIIAEKIRRQLLNIEVWNCDTKTKFVFSTLTRITDMQQITDAISEALNKKELHIWVLSHF